jgi:hypothetical protein
LTISQRLEDKAMKRKTNRSRIADEIKQRITMPEIMEKYGIPVNRNGYAVCPFHSERTGSLRVYNGDRGWHCFGCGAGGSVIDFVMQFFKVDFDSAAFKIIYDFRLNIPFGRKQGIRERALMSEIDANKRELDGRQNALEAQSEADYWSALDALMACDRNARDYAPKDQEAPWDERFVSALQIRSDLVFNFSCAQTALQIISERGRSGGQRNAVGVS